MSIPFIEENDQTRARAQHLEGLRQLVGNVYPNKFERSRATGVEDTITAIVEKFKSHEPVVKEGERPAPEVLESANAELNKVEVRISGRLAVPPRIMGKAAFVHLSDGVSRLQIYVRKADVKGIHNDDNAPIEQGWELFNLLDHGDFIGVSGYLFITKTGELSIHVRELQFLAKAMLPMPDKMHGLTDPEIRQRQRYADLIAGSLKVEKDEDNELTSRELSSREVFERRSKIIREMRRFLDDHGYIEVETPMLTAKATGAAARPFKTHHNALDIDLYARIAPELYLKRLVVGGFERVYELNRNFRNEGIDRTHNPEFTMLEFYCAYMDVNGMMDFCEEMLQTTVWKALDTTRFYYDEYEIDFTKFQRLTMKEAIAEYWPEEIKTLSTHRIIASDFEDPVQVEAAHWFLFELDKYLNELNESHRKAALDNYRQNPYSLGRAPFKTEDEHLASYDFKFVREQATAGQKDEIWSKAQKRAASRLEKEGHFSPSDTALKIQEMFERLVEPRLVQPTFITDFPKPVSPLSKASLTNPTVAERFELFIAGLECANGFSELNDPKEQYDRFLEQAQARERGDEEAMVLDEDYIRALSYGMPPAAGIGIGIDRLVMLLTNKRSIRDVILFPHMRPERKTGEATEEAGKES